MSEGAVSNLGYTVVTQYPTVNFLGGTQTQDAIAVGIITNQSSIYLEFRIPKGVYSATQVKDYSIGYTGTVESAAEAPGVVGVVWSQQPNAAQELTDYLTFTVQSDSGNSSATFMLPMAQVSYANAAKQASALIAQLNDAENG